MREARHARGIERGEDDARHDEVRGPAHAPRGQPVEPDGKEVDQHEAEPEAGDGLSEHGPAHPEIVDEGAPMRGREDADGNGDGEGEEERGQSQLEGSGEPLQDETHGVAPVAQRLAEIAAGRAREKAAVLHGQRIVEAEALAKLVDVLGLDIHGQEEKDGIAGQPYQEEDGGEGEEDHERGLGEPRD